MKIGHIAHDHRKKHLAGWVLHNSETLKNHTLVCTGTTGKIVTNVLYGHNVLGSKVVRLKSGPLGGDQQMGAMIASEEIDMLVSFSDPMAAQPHDPDIKALMRLAVLYNIPAAFNRTTADYMISSELFDNERYERMKYDYSTYVNREI